MSTFSVQVTLDLTVEYDGEGPASAADLRFDVDSLVAGETYSMGGCRAFVADVDGIRVYRGQF